MFGASHITVPLCSATMVTAVLLSNIVVLVSWILSLNLTASLNTCKVSQQLHAPKGMQVMHWKWNKIVWYKPYKCLYLLYTIIVVYYVSILLPAYFMWIASSFLQLDDYLLHWFSDIHIYCMSTVAHHPYIENLPTLWWIYLGKYPRINETEPQKAFI